MKYIEKKVIEHAIYDDARKVWLADAEKYAYVESQLGIAFTLKMFLDWILIGN